MMESGDAIHGSDRRLLARLLASPVLIRSNPIDSLSVAVGDGASDGEIFRRKLLVGV